MNYTSRELADQLATHTAAMTVLILLVVLILLAILNSVIKDRWLGYWSWRRRAKIAVYVLGLLLLGPVTS